ncbi:MAG TPA: hypothetical protein V6C64_08360 [Microcoleaceae cyanobacterium]
MLTNKFWLLKSLCWSSLLLLTPAAIAQEASTSTPQTTTEASAAATNAAPQSVNDPESNLIGATPNSSNFTTTASDLTPVELTAPTLPSAQIPLTDRMNGAELQADQGLSSSANRTDNEQSYHFSSSNLLATLEPPSSPSLPTGASDQADFRSELSSLELAQVRPTAGGVSGPPIPSYPATTAGPSSEPPTTPESEATTPTNKWHLLFQPYVYFPLSIYGDTTVKGFNADFAADASTIFSAVTNTFKFGFFGRLEGWTPDYHWGFLLDGNYLELGRKNNFTRPNPDRFLDLAINRIADRIQAKVDSVLRQQIADYLKNKLDGRIQAELEARLGAKLNKIIPSEFESDVKIQSWNVDLAGAYRIYNQSQVNPKGVATEFDLGPYLLDLAIGVRIAGVSGDLNITTNLGGEGDFSRSVTTVKPLLGTRFRYNFSPRLAAVLAGTIAGFDIGTLGLNWEVMGGLDWMFSGNTSVGLGYRFSYLKYKSGSGSDAFEVSASSNGPYMTFTFRF